MNIILIGFMGSGKTTIGKALAEEKGFKLIDTDEMIEKAQNMPISEIFSKFGEPVFREMEKKAIAQLLGIDNHVISVGGGAVMYFDNLETLKRIGTTIFLDAPLQKILNNLKGKFRPLVGNTIEEDKMKNLLGSRYTTYLKADIIINTKDLDIRQTVDEILKRLDI